MRNVYLKLRCLSNPLRLLTVLVSVFVAGGSLFAAEGWRITPPPDTEFVSPPDTIVRFAVFLPDGKRVLVGRNSGSIEVRTVPTGRREATIQAVVSTDDVAISPDGRIVVPLGLEHGRSELQVWDTATWKLLKPIRVEGKELYGAAFSPNGDLLAIGTKDNTIILWDVKKHAVRKFLHGGTYKTQWFSFAPDGWQMACAGRSAFKDGLESGESRWVDLWFTTDDFARRNNGLHGNSSAVSEIAFMRDSRRLVTSGSDKAIRVFDAYSCQELQTLRSRPGGALIPLPGNRLISASDNALVVWDVGGRLPPGNPASAPSSDLGWEIGTARELAALRLDESVAQLSLSPDGKTLASFVLSFKADRIRFWDVPALLRAHGEVKAAECEKWGGEWRSGPDDKSAKAPASSSSKPK